MKSNSLIIFIFICSFICINSVSALQINDTIFFSSATNFTISVDSITLDQVIVTNQTIQFHNLTSLGSNLTNVNATFDATANFVGLDVGLRIRNINTSSDLFTSILGSQNFNATFTSGQTIQILSRVVPLFTCNAIERGVFDLIKIFGALAILIFTISLVIFKGSIIHEMDRNQLIAVFVGVVITIVFLIVIADSIGIFCP